MDKVKIQQAVAMILEAIGEDLEREGLRDTPKRVADMYEEIFSGVGADPSGLLTTFSTPNKDEMVLVKDIPLYSMCEHHLLPFSGVAHVAYIPHRDRITGLSKLARIVDVLAKKPQLQERLTTEIADTIMQSLEPQGVLVVIEAEHMCMTMRGIKKPGSVTTTSAMRGIFENAATRAEAFSLIRGR